ncbi:unnamed protein product [Ceratitis capitata]|uniref:(Mediterranean fruit fly) hypothetical protein n=1 Tax=Ceratitis capitata TaxID=7213 RepID=A0A811V8U8_CERCA|nr:unnamed protein product [Ceratitis capitata]
MMSAKVIAQVSTQMLKVGLRRDFHELTLTEFSKVGKQGVNFGCMEFYRARFKFTKADTPHCILCGVLTCATYTFTHTGPHDAKNSHYHIHVNSCCGKDLG